MVTIRVAVDGKGLRGKQGLLQLQQSRDLILSFAEAHPPTEKCKRAVCYDIIIMPPPLIGGEIKRCFYLTSVCHVHRT